MSFSPFNMFMERKKPKGSTTDELEQVKAAAWAWYQHGSRSEGKPLREFYLTMTYQAPGPSRFKLDAMRIAEDTMEGSQTPSSIHTDNSLLDSYEIESISKQLDHYMESSGTEFFRGLVAGNYDRYKNVSSNGDTSRMRKKNKILKRFWLKHAVICGTREDVDTRAFGRRPEKQASVVGMATRRPRATHA